MRRTVYNPNLKQGSYFQFRIKVCTHEIFGLQINTRLKRNLLRGPGWHRTFGGVRPVASDDVMVVVVLQSLHTERAVDTSMLGATFPSPKKTTKKSRIWRATRCGPTNNCGPTYTTQIGSQLGECKGKKIPYANQGHLCMGFLLPHMRGGNINDLNRKMS